MKLQKIQIYIKKRKFEFLIMLLISAIPLYMLFSTIYLVFFGIKGQGRVIGSIGSYNPKGGMNTIYTIEYSKDGIKKLTFKPSNLDDAYIGGYIPESSLANVQRGYIPIIYSKSLPFVEANNLYSLWFQPIAFNFILVVIIFIFIRAYP